MTAVKLCLDCLYKGEWYEDQPCGAHPNMKLGAARRLCEGNDWRSQQLCGEMKMSGGHWNYAGERIQRDLEEISTDAAVTERWPILGRIFNVLSRELRVAEHNMDYDLSGDKTIKDDAAFDTETSRRILVTLVRAVLR